MTAHNSLSSEVPRTVNGMMMIH